MRLRQSTSRISKPSTPSRSIGGRARLAVMLMIGILVPVVTPIRPADARISLVTAQWETDMHGDMCGGTQDPLFGTWIVSANPCLIALKTTSALRARSGWNSTQQAAKDNWTVGHPDFNNEVRIRIDNHTANNDIDAQITADAEDLGGPNASGAITLGVARITITSFPTRQLHHVEVVATTNGAITWNVNSGSSYTVPGGEIDLQTVFSHEYGHAVGAHHPVGTATSHTMAACYSGKSLVNSHDHDAIFYMYGHHDDDKYGPIVDNVNSC